MRSDSQQRRFSWRGFRKISAKLPNLLALRHVCGIGGHTRTEKCLWRFSLQMHCNGGGDGMTQWLTPYTDFLQIPSFQKGHSSAPQTNLSQITHCTP